MSRLSGLATVMRAPRDWLQRRQMVLPLLGSLVPPHLVGMMWSGSAESGLRLIL